MYACCNHGCILYPDLADCKIEAVSKCTAYVQCHLKGKLQRQSYDSAEMIVVLYERTQIGVKFGTGLVLVR